MSQIVLVDVTFADAGEAERIADTVLAEGLAACANLVPCRSIYRWDGRIERGEEVIGHFKTSGIRARRLVERLTALHSYELPAIVSHRVDASPELAAWVGQATD